VLEEAAVEEVVATTTGADEEVSGEELEEEEVVATTTGAVEEVAGVEAEAVDAALLTEETELEPVGSSPCLTHPVMEVKAAGHSTCTKSTVGLSAPWNQSNRQLHPVCKAVGKVAQAEAEEIPPYCCPQPDDGAPHSAVHPL